MKFFHLSDLHIGLKLNNADLSEDQIYILDQIAERAAQEKPDAVVIAGDIYDKAIPSAEAVEIFDHFISKLVEAVPEAEIMMISGNHDSAQRVNVFRGVLEHHKIHMIGIPPVRETETIEKVTLTDDEGNVNFYLLPFVKPSMVKMIVGTDEKGNNLSYDETVRRLIAREEINENERNVLVSHQFFLPRGTDPDEVEHMDSEIHTVGNIDVVWSDAIGAFDYTALGHIHKPMKVGSEVIRYCGTPLACSFSEAGQQKGIIVVEMGEKGDVRTDVIPLTPMRAVKKIKGSLEEVLAQGCDDYVSITLTDKADLNVLDMQDRIRAAFKNPLEIRRELTSSVNYSARNYEKVRKSAFELCEAFLDTEDAEELALIQDVINTVKGAGA